MNKKEGWVELLTRFGSLTPQVHRIILVNKQRIMVLYAIGGERRDEVNGRMVVVAKPQCLHTVWSFRSQLKTPKITLSLGTLRDY